MRRLSTALLLLLALFVTARAQDAGAWMSKPYSQWTMKEVEALLSESPWARTIARNAGMVNVGTNPTMMSDKVYTLRLRSALPIRHGLLRLRQLREKYDQMDAKKKAEFDEKNRALVECPACEENYVLALVPPKGDAHLGGLTAFKDAAFDKVKLYVQLTNDRGERRELVHFVPPKARGQEVVFFFPRLDAQGRPLFTPETRRLVFTVDPVLMGDTTITRFEIDVSKLVVDGKVIL